LIFFHAERPRPRGAISGAPAGRLIDAASIDALTVFLERHDWTRRLDPAVPTSEFPKPSSAGSFRIECVG